MENEAIEDLIIRQLEGKLSAAETEWLSAWYKTSGANRKQYEQYYVLLKAAGMKPRIDHFACRREGAYRRFCQRVRRPRKVLLRKFGSYAAIALLFLGIGVLWQHLSLRPEVALLTQQVEVPLGSKSKVTLPDGTQVWLNAGSRLSYTRNFGEKERLVVLDGEGFFDVVKDRACPFNVQSGKLKVKVLGTKFNLKSYVADAGARVTLLEGSLKVSGEIAGEEGVILKPDEQAVIDKQAGKMRIRKVTAEDFVQWTQPKGKSIGESKEDLKEVVEVNLQQALFFDEEPLEQIVCDLERAFQVRIVIADEELGKVKFYGDFRNGETILQIMEIISKNHPIRYVVEGKQITIYGKND